MTDPNAASAVPAPLWRRLLALAYELLAVLSILFVTDMVCLLLTRGHLDAHAAWFRAVLLLAVAAYFLLSWTRGGQTLGMRPWRLRLRATDGGPVTLKRAILRFVVLAAPLLLLALAPLIGSVAAMIAPFVAWAVYVLVAVFDRRRRTLHDRVSATVLLYRAPAKHKV